MATKKKQRSLADMLGDKTRDAINEAEADRKLGPTPEGNYYGVISNTYATALGRDNRPVWIIEFQVRRGPNSTDATYAGREHDLVIWKDSPGSVDFSFQNILVPFGVDPYQATDNPIQAMRDTLVGQEALAVIEHFETQTGRVRASAGFLRPWSQVDPDIVATFTK